MRTYLLPVYAALLLTACATSRREAHWPGYWSLPPLDSYAGEQHGNSAPVLLAMVRTACFGTCPVYRVVVRTDGQVEYFGGYYVAKAGAHSARLKPQQVSELRSILGQADLAGLDLSRWRCPVSQPDVPGVELIAPLSGLRERICYPVESSSTPQYLKTLTLGGLDIKVDLIVGTERWSGDRPVYRE